MPRINIQYKLTLIITSIVAVILIGIFFYLNNNLKSHTFKRIQSNLTKNVFLSKSYLEDHYSKNKTLRDVDAVTDKIGKDLDVRVTTIDMKGKVLGDSELDGQQIRTVENHFYRPEIQRALNSGFGESHRFSNTIKKDMLYMAVPFGQPVHRGFIRLAIPLSDIEIISENLKRLLLFSMLIAFLLSIIIGSITSVFVSNPIKNISLIAKTIADGDYSQRIDITTNDEIEDLSKAINYMSSQIKLRIDEILANKSRFEAVLLSMFEGVMVIDERGVILLMNETSKRILHVESDPIGKRPIEIIRNIEIQEIADKVLKRLSGVESKELSILFPEEIALQIHATPIVRDEKNDGAVLVFHDITELRKLEIVRRDFVANVSHELRTPITNIKGYAETLLDGALDEKKNAKEFLGIINSDSERLAQLVDDLLELSKIESGKLNLNFNNCNIKDIVDRVVLGLKKQAKDKKVTIKNNIPKDIADVKADENSISQVVLNLIDNAIKYNKPDGVINISAADEGEYINVQIEDSGIGIPDEDLPRIFERFYRVDKARSRQLGGTGLGLSIAKHIIQSHQGEMTASSEQQRGSIFNFTLPKA